jgi:integrase
MKEPSTFPAELPLKNFKPTVYRRDYRKTVNGKPRDYVEFKFAFYDSADKRQFRTASSWDGIEKAARQVADTMQAGNADVLTLTGEDRLIYSRAAAAVKPLGIALDVAALEYAQIRAMLGDVPPLVAARFFKERHSVTTDKTVRKVVDELIDSMDARQKKVSTDYAQDVRLRLGKFADSFHVAISTITPAQIAEYLAQFKGRTRFNHARLVRTLFRFAQAKKYFARDADPFEGVEVDFTDDGDVEIFTAEEISKLLGAARPEMLPFVAIGAFGGLRSAELERLDWSEIRDDHIVLKKGKAKTRSRRLVPIQPNLRAWLAPYRREAGPVVPLVSIGKQIVKLAKDAGVTWKHNALRHSFISYRLAATNDENRVAAEAGNSPQMIHQNYRQLVTEQDGKAWFSIEPQLPDNVIPQIAEG